LENFFKVTDFQDIMQVFLQNYFAKFEFFLQLIKIVMY